MKRFLNSLVLLLLLSLPVQAATLDRAVCSTADKSGGACSTTVLLESTNQEISKLYQGNALKIQSLTGTNNLAGATTPAATSLTDGEMRVITIVNENTGPVTYNDNSIGAIAVTTAGGSALDSGNLKAGYTYVLTYNGSGNKWIVLTPLGTGATSASNPFVTTSLTAALTDERVLTGGNCLTVTDGGSNSTATVAVASCSSANLASGVTDETGSGNVVFSTSPSLTTPAIGSAGMTFAGSSSGTATLKAPAVAGTAVITLPLTTDTLVGTATGDTLSNKTISFSSNTITATSANLAAAVTDETGSGAAVFATSPTLVTPNLGTPSAVTLTNATGLPVSTGVSGLGAGVSTFLATPSSANLATAVTNETGSGTLVFNTSPSLTTPAIGSGGATFAGSSSGTTTVAASAVASGTLTLPAATDTLVGQTTAQTLTNKTMSLGSNTLTTTSAQLATAVSDETGSGSAVFATSPTLTTPNIGVATATSVNKVAITAPATSATITLTDGTTVTGPAASGTIMTLGNAETITGAKTFGTAGNVGKLNIAGTTSGTTTLNASATASGTLTLPAATDTLVGKATTDTLTNKTYDTAGTGNSFSIAGVAVTTNTGTGAVVRQTSPSLTTPTIGSGGMTFTGSSSGSTVVAASAAASGTLTLPAASDTLVGKATTDTLTNKSLSLGSNTLTATSAQMATAISDETGSGAAVFATSPSLTTPDLGTPSAATLTNATGLPVSTGIAGLGVGVATALATPSSANLAAAVSDETGSGALVFGTSPTFTTDLTLGSDTITDFTGFGLAMNSGALGIDITSAADEFCLTYESTGPALQWQSCGGGGGGGSPGGSNGDIQFNNAGSFDGFTMSGDVTVDTSTGVATIGSDAVGSTEIAANSIGNSEMADDAIGTAEVANDAVTYAKMQNVGANSVLANNTSSSGDAAEVALSASRVLGRGSTGDIAALTPTNGLTISGTNLKLDVNGLTSTDPADDDTVPFSDTSDSNNSKKVTLKELYKFLRREAHKNSFHFFTDFVAETSATGTDGALVETNSGTGAGTAQHTASFGQAEPGAVALQTGTTATGRNALTSGLNIMQLGGGEVVLETYVYIAAASTSSQRYQLVVGFLDTATAANQVDAVAFVYDEGGVSTGSTATANWQAVTANNSTRTWNAGASGSTAVATTTGYQLKIVINAAGTQADFYVDGNLRYTHTTNIPTAANRDTSFGYLLIKSVGTTNAVVYTTRFMVDQEFTAARY